jgi:hypothetical protein
VGGCMDYSVGVIHGSVGPWLLGRIGLGVGSSELVSEI